MTANVLDPSTPRGRALLVGAAAFAYVLLALLATSIVLQQPSKTWFVISAAAALGPFAFGWALKAPMVFPFCLYVAFLPFEPIFEAGPVGSVAKLLALVCAAALLLRMIISRDVRNPGRSVFAWGVLVLWMTASAVWAISDLWIVSVERYAQLYIFFVIVAFSPVTRRDILVTIAAFVLGGIVAAVYGDYLFAHGMGVRGDNRLFVQVGDRRTDPNIFSAALLMPAGMLVMLSLRERLGLRKIGLLCLLGIVATGFYTSGSRGGLIAVACMCAYFFIRSRYKMQLGFVLATGLAIVVSGPLLDRFNRIGSTGGNGRASIWRSGYYAFVHNNWFLGTGVGTFPDAYQRVYLQTSIGNFGHWNIVAHNLVIQTGVELGLVGLAISAYCWWTQLQVLRGTRGSSLYNDLRILAEGVMLGLLVDAMFIDLLATKMLWAAFIFAAMLRTYARSKEAADDAQAELEYTPSSSLLSPLLPGGRFAN